MPAITVRRTDLCFYTLMKEASQHLTPIDVTAAAVSGEKQDKPRRILAYVDEKGRPEEGS